MTFLAILFAMAPSLQAAACAAEGCGLSCISGVDQDKNGSSEKSGGCTEKNCVGIAAHHHGAASVFVADEPVSITEPGRLSFAIISDTVAAGVSPGLERPPRA